MKTLCIVPCGKAKIWDKKPNAGPTPARLVYIGPFASKCREYAETFYPHDYCILSAKYGFLYPNDIVPGDYETSFNKPATHPITVTELRKIADDKKLTNYSCIMVLGGKKYVDITKQVFLDQLIEMPLHGLMGIGVMMGVLNKAIEDGIPI